MNRTVSFRAAAVCLLLLAALVVPTTLSADEVTDWNAIALQSVATAKTNPLVTTRVMAIVQASVFDAVNGIERRYDPIHVAANAPRGASQRAAAVQAAYTALVTLFPTQKPALDAALQQSLNAIASGAAAENSVSIALGRAWGQLVANDIMAWRGTDHFTPNLPPFVGGTAIGQWRPTPPGFAPGAAPQFAIMTPWAISSPNQFRSFAPGPPTLTSAAYAADFNETKTMGALVGSPRTADQTELAYFWNGNTPLYWNRIATTISAERHLTLSDNARVFGLLNIAMADAAIACWDAKYQYVFWRPITAVALADMDGNAATIADPAWLPLLNTAVFGPPSFTPPHPEYPSGHSTVSGAAVAVLIATFGDSAPFSIDSESVPGVWRSFANFSAALAEIHNARVFGGIHFRSACRDGSALGEAVAAYVMQNAMQSAHGERIGNIVHDHGTGTVAGQGELQTDDSL